MQKTHPARGGADESANATPVKLPRGVSERDCSKTDEVEEEFFFVTFDMFEGSRHRRSVQVIIYRLSRAEGWGVGVGWIRRGSAPELHRLPILVVPGALHCLLRWRQRDRSLLVAWRC